MAILPSVSLTPYLGFCHMLLGNREVGEVPQEYLSQEPQIDLDASLSECNAFRTRLSPGKDAPTNLAIQRLGRDVARPILGGLHHQYSPTWSSVGTSAQAFRAKAIPSR